MLDLEISKITENENNITDIKSGNNFTIDATNAIYDNTTDPQNIVTVKLDIVDIQNDINTLQNSGGGGGGGSNPSYGNIVLPSTAYGNNDSHEDGSKFFVTHSSNDKYYVETLNGGLKVSEGDIVGKADGKYYHIYNHELEREQLGSVNNANGGTWEYFLVSGVTGNSDWGLVWNSCNCFLNFDVSPPVVLQYEPLTTDG